MANIRKQSYLKRDFESVRADLEELLKIYYPNEWKDFNSPSAGMSLVDLLAYVSDLLSFYTDKKFNELFLDSVSERTAVFRLAKTFGFNPPGFRPGITLADFSIDVPTTANGPDESYLPIYRPGVQVKGAGQIFETINEIDFSSDFSEDGTANRKIEPVFNANQDILRYTITKRELIKAGTTLVFKKELTSEDAATPFLEVFLPEDNVLEIINVIVKPSTGIIGDPTFAEFNDFDIRYFEVSELAQDTVFLEDDTEPAVDNVKVGKNVEVSKRFKKEFMADGSCKLTFGGGTPGFNAYEEYLTSLPINGGEINLSQVFDNTALGEKLPSDSTLYIKYRIGGGNGSNVGANTLQQVGNINAVILGADETLNQDVISSTRVNNIIPAIGGAEPPTVDEIKNFIASNFASQERCVTLNDYIARAYQIPGKFGAPFRIFGKVEDNKVKMYILTRDANGNLLTVSTNTVKNNLRDFLIPFRMVNDFVEVNDGKVVNLSAEIDIFTDKNFSASEIKTNVLNKIKDFFDITKWQMNQHIYISQLTDEIREVPGVINVIDVRFFNLEGFPYSNTLSSQATEGREKTSEPGVFRTQIEPIDNAIFSTPISMFEVKFPEKSIKIRVK